MNKYYYNDNYFKIIDSEDKAYWLGFLYADGCVITNYKNDRLKSMSLEISLCEEDKGHLEKFAKCLESNLIVKDRTSKYKDKEYKSCRLNVNSTNLCKDLIALNCTPRKTYDITFPSYNIVPEKYMRDFLRGFFDGDGCISITEMNGNPHIVLCITGMSDMLKSISDFYCLKI